MGWGNNAGAFDQLVSKLSGQKWLDKRWRKQLKTYCLLTGFLDKYTSCHLPRSFKSFSINAQWYFSLIAPTDDVLSSNIANKLVFRHRAASYTFYGTVKSQATGSVGCLYLFRPFAGCRMKMRAYVQPGKGWQ